MVNIHVLALSFTGLLPESIKGRFFTIKQRPPYITMARAEGQSLGPVTAPNRKWHNIYINITKIIIAFTYLALLALAKSRAYK